MTPTFALEQVDTAAIRQASRIGIWLPFGIAEAVLPQEWLPYAVPAIVAWLCFALLCVCFWIAAGRTWSPTVALLSGAIALTGFVIWATTNIDTALKPVAALMAATGLVFAAVKLRERHLSSLGHARAGLVVGLVAAATYCVYFNLGASTLLLGTGLVVLSLALPGSVDHRSIASRAVAYLGGVVCGVLVTMCVFIGFAVVVLGFSVEGAWSLLVSQAVFAFSSTGEVQSYAGPQLFSDPLHALTSSPGPLLLVMTLIVACALTLRRIRQRQNFWDGSVATALIVLAAGFSVVGLAAHAVILDLYTDKWSYQWLIPLTLILSAAFFEQAHSSSAKTSVKFGSGTSSTRPALATFAGAALLLALSAAVFPESGVGIPWDSAIVVMAAVVAALLILLAWSVDVGHSAPYVTVTSAALAVLTLSLSGNYYVQNPEYGWSFERQANDARVVLHELAQRGGIAAVSAPASDLETASTTLGAVSRTLSNCRVSGDFYMKRAILPSSPTAVNLATPAGPASEVWARRGAAKVATASGVALRARERGPIPAISGVDVWTFEAREDRSLSGVIKTLP